MGDNGIQIELIRAQVSPLTDEERREMIEQFRTSDAWQGKAAELEAIEQKIMDPDAYEMRVRLVAQLSDGRAVSAEGFTIKGRRRGLGAIHRRYRGPQLSDDPQEHRRLLAETYHARPEDVADAITQMLGRDPEQHRPPRLSWDGLQRALADIGVDVDDDELIAAPFEMELSPAAVADLAASQDGESSNG